MNTSITVAKNTLAMKNTPPAELELAKEAAMSSPHGAEAMRCAADLVLEQFSLEVAEALYRCAIAGSPMAARLLYLIAHDRLMMTAEEIRKRKSLAAMLLAEEQFQAELKEDAENAGCTLDPAFDGVTIDAKADFVRD